MSSPRFSLCYTSARPEAIKSVVEHWNHKSQLNNHEWVVSVDEGHTAAIAAANAIPGVTVVLNTGPKNCVAGWNAAAAAATGDILIAVADDFYPPRDWDSKLLACGPDGWWEKDHVVHINDGYVKKLCTLAILTRARYTKFGYLFYPGYASLYCDTEFGDHAYQDGVVLPAEHLLFEHIHYGNSKRPKDSVDASHASKIRKTHGRALYLDRKRNGFPIDAGPNKVAKSKPIKRRVDLGTEFCVFLQVTQNDLCLREVCRAIQLQRVQHFAFFQPDRYWSGEPVPEKFADEIKAIAAELEAAGATCYFERKSVAPFVSAKRIDTETKFRNSCLASLRARGFNHVLIADGDELWVPGALDHVRQLINKGAQAVNVGMIPVVGIPPFPVSGAKDHATVYVGPHVSFSQCRTPTVSQVVIAKPLIYHFTGVRPTMEATILKHKRSGHYDDPNYAFDEWLEKRLPNLKPGDKDIHFYKKWQIWPALRDWLPGEKEKLPASVLKLCSPKNTAS